MIEQATVNEFLAQRRIVVAGASDDKKNFGGAILRALRDHGYDAVGVNPNATTAAGVRCWPDLASVPGPVDGVIVMVPADAKRGSGAIGDRARRHARMAVPRESADTAR